MPEETTNELQTLEAELLSVGQDVEELREDLTKAKEKFGELKLKVKAAREARKGR